MAGEAVDARDPWRDAPPEAEQRIVRDAFFAMLDHWAAESSGPVYDAMQATGWSLKIVRRIAAETGLPPAKVFASRMEMALGVASVTLSRDGERFEFGGPDGRLCVLVRDERWLPTDICAVSTTNPDQWEMWSGEGVMLGAMALEQARERGEDGHHTRLRLHSTPMGWLRQGAWLKREEWGARPLTGREREIAEFHGLEVTEPVPPEFSICVLDWRRALPLLRALPDTVEIRADAGTGEKLRGLLAHGGLPMVREAAPVRVKMREAA